MSADNGIYILQTLKTRHIEQHEVYSEVVKEPKEYEYRVKELQNIENLNFDKSAPNSKTPHDVGSYVSVYSVRPEDKMHVEWQESYMKRYHSHDPDIMISNAREMYKNSRVFNTEEEALMYAAKLLEKSTMDCGFEPEYGISYIKIARVF